jgi:hypothetical protein
MLPALCRLQSTNYSSWAGFSFVGEYSEKTSIHRFHGGLKKKQLIRENEYDVLMAVILKTVF